MEVDGWLLAIGAFLLLVYLQGFYSQLLLLRQEQVRTREWVQRLVESSEQTMRDLQDFKTLWKAKEQHNA